MIDAIKGFIAYPAKPAEIGRLIESTVKKLAADFGCRGFATWQNNDVPGRVLIEPIYENIDCAHILIADVTKLNFNVTYELGYAIGKKKRVFLTRCSAMVSDDQLADDVGVYDSLGYAPYTTPQDLAETIAKVDDFGPIRFDDSRINTRAPLYIILPTQRTDEETRLISRIKKARINFRSFEPQEQGRLSPSAAIDNVAESLGIVAPLLGLSRIEHAVHNLRAAFVAGLAHGMGKELLLLQRGLEPVPLDYRDFVHRFGEITEIDEHVAAFVPAVTEQLQHANVIAPEGERNFLGALDLGASAAENEFEELGAYFVETDEFNRALRGEVELIVGRKGSGKTALFAMIRNKVRNNRRNVVLDLKPEGYQLAKLKDSILRLLEEGTKEHTVRAFWEYVLLLEICHKLLEKDRQPHRNDPRLFDAYRRLEQEYKTDRFIAEGDFAERMSELLNRILDDFRLKYPKAETSLTLTREQITGFLYKHDIPKLRESLHDYLELKESLLILFDNVDKGWSAKGIDPNDIVIVRCLLDSLHQLKRGLNKRGVNCNAILFLRDDVFQTLLDQTPDRGKFSRASVDWREPEMLRELLRRRLVQNIKDRDCAFDAIWPKLCVPYVAGEESSQYLIDRCLMRPRALIDLVKACRTRAVNLQKERIEEDDIREGEQRFSADLVLNVSYEIRDIFPAAQNALYEMIGAPKRLSRATLEGFYQRMNLRRAEMKKVEELMMWYGILGIARGEDKVSYIYDVNYDTRLLDALKRGTPPESDLFYVNPAFWLGLEIVS